MTVTQGETRNTNLANGLPCSNRLSYRVTRQLNRWVWVLKFMLCTSLLKLIQWSLTEKKTKRVTPNRSKGTMQQIFMAWYHSPLSSLSSLFPPPMKTMKIHAYPACPIPQHPGRGFESLPESLSLSFPLFIFFFSVTLTWIKVWLSGMEHV